MIEGFVVRGLFSVWLTRGPENLLARLNAIPGVKLQISDHGTWPNSFGNVGWLTQQSRLIKERNSKLVLVGHSFGASAIINVCDRLANQDIDVDLLVPIDPAAQCPCVIRPNAKRIVGFFQKEPMQLGQGVDTPSRGWTHDEWSKRCVQYQRHEGHIAIINDFWVYDKIAAEVCKIR